MKLELVKCVQKYLVAVGVIYLSTDSSGPTSTTVVESSTTPSYPVSSIRSSCINTHRLQQMNGNTMKETIVAILLKELSDSQQSSLDNRLHEPYQWQWTTMRPAAMMSLTRSSTGLGCSRAIICLSSFTCCCHCGVCTGTSVAVVAAAVAIPALSDASEQTASADVVLE